MKPINSIDRSFQNQRNEVQETDVPKSGFNLTYRNHLGGLILGRLYPQSVQHTMPNDKFSGNNEANLTFERLVTPVIDDVDVCVHNFLVTLRSIDKQWEKFMTPSKLNNMGNGISVPTFDLSCIIFAVLYLLQDLSIVSFTNSSTASDPQLRIVTANLSSFTGWDDVYHSDSVHDLSDQLDAILGNGISYTYHIVTNDSDKEKFRLFLYAIFDFFIGKRSLLDFLGYNMITRNDYDIYFDQVMYIVGSYSNSADGYSVFDWLTDQDSFNTAANNFVFYYDGSTKATVYSAQNEYALRAYYAIWFEYYRNYDLEPRSPQLPEYHDFAASTIFGTPNTLSSNYPVYAYTIDYMHYLVPRIRSWQQDAFTTAGIDDISRHVFAPVLTLSEASTAMDDTSLQASNVQDNRLVEQVINWRDPATNSVVSVQVPMPARFISSLQGSHTSYNTPALELFSLRKAQMLENFLKRIYYGGDEYRDRMLHLYGARIEDYRINRPQWLSSSLDMVNPRQEVANTGIAADSTAAGVTPIGSRVATATGLQSGSDGFTEFCPEFGIYISMLSIMPHATYDPLLLQNLNKTYADFPIPQFANQMEDVISTLEISRRSNHSAFGYAPYGHSYRYRVDEIHGDYHDDKFDYCFLRFFDQSNIPNLSWSFIHCRPKLPMFVNSVLLDGQVYGTFKHNFLVERPLPSPVETI